jgi:uncharacterized membrane protein YphA (DoxX/SURF4 family)
MMKPIHTVANFLADLQETIYSKVGNWDGVPLLALRLYLGPVLIVAGWTKFEHMSNTVQFFSNIGIPLSSIMGPLAASTELFGGILLLFGVATRLIAIPLAITMLVAAFTVHWSNGWFAFAQGSPEHSPARVVALTHLPSAVKSQKEARENASRIQELKKIVDSNRRGAWIKEGGSPTLAQNGIEFAMTYFIMLLVLCFYGGGRYVSADYYICRSMNRK